MSTKIPLRRKLVVVGDYACGKTSLLHSFVTGESPEGYHPRIYEDYIVDIRLDGKAVQLSLWDTTGMEEYERLRPLSYSKSHVILIAFAIDTPDSLGNVTVKWIKEVRSICGPVIPILLVGCKAESRPPSTDPNIDRYISRVQAERVAQSIGACAYKECSAHNIESVNDVFEAATRASLLMREGVSVNVRGRSSVSGDRDEINRGRSCVIC